MSRQKGSKNKKNVAAVNAGYAEAGRTASVSGRCDPAKSRSPAHRAGFSL